MNTRGFNRMTLRNQLTCAFYTGLAARDPEARARFIVWCLENCNALLSFDPLVATVLVQQLLPTHSSVLLCELRTIPSMIYTVVRPLLFAHANTPGPDGIRDHSFIRELIRLDLGQTGLTIQEQLLLITSVLAFPDDFNLHYRLDDLHRALQNRPTLHPVLLEFHRCGFRCTSTPPKLKLSSIEDYQLICQTYGAAIAPTADPVVSHPKLVGLFEQNMCHFAPLPIPLTGATCVPLCLAVLNAVRQVMCTGPLPDLRGFCIPSRPERILSALLVGPTIYRATDLRIYTHLVGPRGIWWSMPGAARVRSLTVHRIIERIKRHTLHWPPQMEYFALLRLNWIRNLYERFPPGPLVTDGEWKNLLIQYLETAVNSRWPQLPSDIRRLVYSYATTDARRG